MTHLFIKQKLSYLLYGDNRTTLELINNLIKYITGDNIPYPELEPADDEVNDKIISEYKDAERTDFVMGKMVFKSENFIFTVTQFTSDFTIAEVEEK